MHLAEIPTPALLLDRFRLERNCHAMTDRAGRLGVALRPHAKTAKCVEVAALAARGQPGGLTVSTLAEARFFAARGFRDLTYAVGVVPDKLSTLNDLQRETGTRIHLLLDSAEAARAVSDRAGSLGSRFEVFIELDTGAGRAGVAPEGPELLDIGRLIHEAESLGLAGVLTHAGNSYHARGAEAIRAVAEAERDGAVLAAQRLRAAGLPCPVVSIGSTPTAVHHARSLAGVTELRPGVYVFHDLDQWALGVCALDDLALSVLATVIGHGRRAGRVLVDAGALALSKDLSAGEFRDDLGYGLVCEAGARGNEPIPGLRVAELYQEHGALAAADGGSPPFERLPIGSRVRILPHHACLTAAPFDRYHVVEESGAANVAAVWEKATGW